MKLPFYKYQGTGNDFVMIDDRNGLMPETVDAAWIQHLCDRRMGIGADGVIALREHPELDFTMVYWNADGSQSFCGNGSRCAMAFAKEIGMVGDKASFLSTDGEHEAHFMPNGWVSLAMHNVAEVEQGPEFDFLDTGSPHVIRFVNDPAAIDVVEQGKAIRYNNRFNAEGTNVNFVTLEENCLHVRTYERGVEDETLSCGTGVTAAAIAAAERNLVGEEVPIQTLGGALQIRWSKKDTGVYTNIRLEGPATFVFKGELNA